MSASQSRMTGRERVTRICRRQPVDRIGLFEEFWDDTARAWAAESGVPAGSSGALAEHFDLDMEKPWPFDFTADLDFQRQVVEETEETILVRDGNGALLRTHKLHVSTPEHVDFLCRDRDSWEERIKPLLAAERRRINLADYRHSRDRARERDSFLMCPSWNVFQVLANLCGHEHLLVGMALDPDWVKDMVDIYSRIAVELHEILFAEEGLPDGLFLMEDLGFKGKPFVSPPMFREIIAPAYRRIISLARAKGLPVLFHSCGYVEPLVPDLIEVGIDCLTALEVKAGMNIVKLYRAYGGVLSFMGGIDTRVLCTNDRALIDRELEATIPVVKSGYGYILSSDHSIPDTVQYDTYRYFMEKGLALGAY
jgi:uroporphyrinogen decarboxylase